MTSKILRKILRELGLKYSSQKNSNTRTFTIEYKDIKRDIFVDEYFIYLNGKGLNVLLESEEKIKSQILLFLSRERRLEKHFFKDLAEEIKSKTSFNARYNKIKVLPEPATPWAKIFFSAA